MSITGQLGPVVDIAPKLMTELSAGRPTRVSLGQPDTAFAWAAGAPRTFANFVSTVQAESMRFGVVIAGNGTTPAAKVAPKGQKPTVCDLQSKSIALSKWSGLCSFTLEDELSSAGLVQAVTYSIVAKALVAFEADLAAYIVAHKGSTVEGADWNEGILKAVGAIVAAGGNPSVLAMAAEDFAAALTAPSNLVFNGLDAIPAYLGLQLHISSGLTAGTAVVLDRSAVMVAEHTDSPSVVIDPFSAAGTNEIRIAASLVAGYEVVVPSGVVTVTKSA
jgi:hypothetical protein